MFYSPTQWMLLFFVYCFLGWVWETAYVSVRTRHLENRGFMHGPFLPIYGSGAIVILLATLGVRDNLLLIYLFGMLSSTVLEYCTGAAMQKLFGVRYWDYSQHKFNLGGHICLFVSLAWGGFSILLVRVLHPPIENLLLQIPAGVTDVIAMGLAVLISVDMTISVNEALDLKAMLMKKAESNEELRRLQSRIDFVYALAEDDIRKFKAEQEAKAEKFRDRFERNLQEARSEYETKLAALRDYAESYFAEQEEEAQERFDFYERLEAQRKKLAERTDKEYRRAARILRRNPGAVSRNFEDELAQIHKLMRK